MSVSPQKVPLKKSWLDKLTRITYSTNLIPEIESLRFLAIITVVMLHLDTTLRRVSPVKFNTDRSTDWIGYITGQGGIGIFIFFAISGFVLSLPFARYFFFQVKKVNLKDYYIRRLTRLEPPFVIALTFFYLMMVLVLGKSLLTLFPHFLATVFYAHLFVYNEWSIINPVTWSLETEVQFYIVMPCLAYIFAIRRPWLRRLLLISIMATWIVAVQFYWRDLKAVHLGSSILLYLPRFLPGFLFADLYLSYKEYFAKKSFSWDILGLIAIAGLFYCGTTYIWYNLFLFSLLIIVLFFSVFKGKWLNPLFTNKFIMVTGGMCYTIYLLHYPFLAMAMSYSSGLFIGSSFIVNLFLQSLIILPLLFLVSAAFFITIEKPCMKKDWPQKFYKYFSNLFDARNESNPNSRRPA